MRVIVNLTWMVFGALLLAASAIWCAGSVLVAPVPAVIPDAALALAHESVSFQSGSGSLIRGWYVPASQPVGAAVLMHGVRANRLSMMGRAKVLHDAGYAVLLFDFQAHGESPGEHLTLGHLEALDAEAAVTYLKQRTGNDFVAAIGVSLGGAAAVLGKEPLAVQALILEATYPSIDVAVQNRLEIRLGSPGRFLAPLLLAQLAPRLGIDVRDLSPETGVRRVSAPLLIIAGETDRHTTPADTRRLFDAAPMPKELWFVPGAAHIDFERHARDEYRTRVLAFLEACRRDARTRDRSRLRAAPT